ncbi:16S rRNA (adenine(1518)-N(6)/adenine(1519)-N(6))-dimethyltransferase RsmA [Desulfovibrio litoralis]|uniref:Ribosomal RNA small subunit methyltransferase A n=1 Tax=Desulfovibrio litoralis DSM 11393 TaxID=1121455 RepID=A0A1M7RZZ8_9BACT|nr:16S rRNA (adenine(1518)-N(6)/adenine(1519)-N(6))-dimethyltransferase RsmA [Desulfovibrio litoralis]SHN51815.1 dimethyladenosine transferase [Desulfovibrio litoralis DSM 11393]
MQDLLNSPRAKKSLGQNFLQDKNIATKIVNALGITHDDNVLEIGPGPGALSSLILQQNPSLFFMLEKDYHWARVRFDEVKNSLKEKEAQKHQVILGDALNFDWERFGPDWKFIGNLPYNIASPIMWDLLSNHNGFKRAVFMIQKEVAERIIAKPDTKAYGALSIWLQTFTCPKILFHVPPHVFFPAPKVTSSVICFEPLKNEFSPEDKSILNKLLSFCFQRRRKQLQNIFKEFFGDNGLIFLDKCDIKHSLRPENLTCNDFKKLVQIIKNKNNA